MKLDNMNFNTISTLDYANKPTKSHDKIKKLMNSTMDKYSKK